MARLEFTLSETRQEVSTGKAIITVKSIARGEKTVFYNDIDDDLGEIATPVILGSVFIQNEDKSVWLKSKSEKIIVVVDSED